MLRRCGEYVVSVNEQYERSMSGRGVVYRSLVALGIVLLISLCAYGLRLNLATVSLLLLASILVTALRSGFIEAIVASFGAAGCLDYFFIPPILSLHMQDPKNWVALSVFLFTSVVVSRLSAQSRAHARSSELNSRHMEMLYELSRATLFLDRGSPAGAQMVLLIAKTINVDAVIIFDGSLGRLDFSGFCSESDGSLARTAYASNMNSIHPTDDTWQRVLRLGQHPFGGIVLRGKNLSGGIVDAVASLTAIAFERVNSFEKESRAEAARQAEQLRTAVLDSLAHEFKTPLTVIMTASSCLTEMGDLRPEQMEMASLISGQTAELDTLATRLLRKAKLEAGDFKLRKQDVLVSQLINRALIIKTGKLDRQRIQISADSSNTSVRVDEELIATAIGEFIENAEKYSTRGSPIRISVTEEDSQVLISVQNEGSQIGVEDRVRIFERFYRSQDAPYRASGTGLGLSIVHKIAEAHAGKVWVTSEQDEGTIFFLSLPPITRSIC